MARNDKKEYWGVDLPKGHFALQQLDQFCEDQGMIPRADATKMILIAWAKAQRGQDASIWAGQSSASPVDNTARFEARSASPVRHPMNNNAASVELDL